MRDLLQKARQMGHDELKTLAKLCSGMAALVLVALVLSGSIALPNSLRLALLNLGRSANTAAVAQYATPGTYTYTVPAGVTQIYVSTFAGGGGGGQGRWSIQACAGDAYMGGGGGSGGYVLNQPVSVTPGQTFTVTVGAGGAGNYSGNCNTSSGVAGAGGNSTVVNNSNSATVASAIGGGGGASSAAGGSGGAAGSPTGGTAGQGGGDYCGGGTGAASATGYGAGGGAGCGGGGGSGGQGGAVYITYPSTVQTFTSSGTFYVPTGVTSVDVLVVGGGGSGGGNGGGGGGGGGVIENTNYSVTPGDVLAVTVGAGGPADSNAPSSGDGQNSVFNINNLHGSAMTAIGGGGGASRDAGGNAAPGGSGGGGGGGQTGGGAGTAGQGNAGGIGYNNGCNSAGAGGGGGRTAGSSSSGSFLGGAGGAGTLSGASGMLVFYGGGGGGGLTCASGNAGVGGLGGGGHGGDQANATSAGTSGTGGGGGGGGGIGTIAGSVVGGSGVVIVSYTLPPAGPLSITANPSSVTSAASSVISWEAPATNPGSTLACSGSCSGGGTTNLGSSGWSIATGNLSGLPVGASPVVIINNYLYRFGGYTGSAISNIIASAPVSNPTAWSNVGTIPVALYDQSVAMVGNYVYIFGGYNGSAYVNTIYRASVSNPTIFTQVGTLPSGAPLAYQNFAVIGDSLYFFGGYNGSAYVNTIWSASAQSPTSWTQIGSMNASASAGDGSVVVYNGNVYVIGGVTAGGTPNNSTIYMAPLSGFASAGNWTLVGAVPNGYGYDVSALVLGSNLYLLGGYNGTNWSGQVVHAALGNPLGSWTTDVASLGASYGTGANTPVIIGNTLYLFGGVTSANVWSSNIVSAPVSTGLPLSTYGMPSWTTDNSLNTGITWPVSANSIYTLSSTLTVGGATSTSATISLIQSAGLTLTPTPASTNINTASNLAWTSTNINTGSCAVVQINPSNTVSTISALGVGDNTGTTTGILSQTGTYTYKLTCVGPFTSGNNGTFVGSPASVTGKFGQALDFSGNSDLMTLASPISFASGTWSISAWFVYPLPATGSGYNTLARGTNDHEILVQQSTNLLGTYDNTGGTNFHSSGFNMSALSSGWHHIVAVGTGGSTKYYVDGTSVGTANFEAVSNLAYIGNCQPTSCSGQQFGTVDDVRVYNRALSSDEILTLATGGTITNGLVGYWPFDTNAISGTMAYDLAGGAGTTKTVYLTSGTTWTVPSDWNSSNNAVEVIAGGGGGSGALYTIAAGSGGGGGAYSKISNLSLTPGSFITYTVGAGGAAGSGTAPSSGSAGGDTYFNGTSCTGSSACAKGGSPGLKSPGPAGTTAPGGAGGAASNGVGTTKYSGGAGGSSPTIGQGAGGGGGAGGPHGAGAAGAPTGGSASGGSGGGGGGGGSAGNTAGSGTTGGYGGNNYAGSGAGLGSGSSGNGCCVGPGGGGGGGGGVSTGTAGAGGAGGAGTDWDSSHGAGGGGGGGSGDTSSGTAGAGGGGGLYGGGGAGGGYSASGQASDGNAGAGAQGIVVITYASAAGTGIVSQTATVAVSGVATLPSIVSFTASRVQKGSASTLSWNVTGMAAGLSCNIQPAPASGQISWPGGGTWQSSATTNPITQVSTFTLSCGNGTASSTATANATLVPTVQEI